MPFTLWVIFNGGARFTSCNVQQDCKIGVASHRMGNNIIYGQDLIYNFTRGMVPVQALAFLCAPFR